MAEAIPITAIVAAYDREEATRETIRRLQACDPAPAEILVHLDNGADFELPAGVRVLRSSANVGPGGGRNRMIHEAAHEWVASFDDDSYPVSSDFFAKLGEVIRRYPEAGVIAAVIRHRNPQHDSHAFEGEREVVTFVGCGCVYRKSAFLKTEGYLPLPVAYGMEEVDLSLQLHAQGVPIIESPLLKVFHDTDLTHHESARITAGSIMNQALLAWLRYPLFAIPYGFLQWANKIVDNVLRGRIGGSIRGVLETPAHLWRYRALRRPVSVGLLRSFRNIVQRGSVQAEGDE